MRFILILLVIFLSNCKSTKKNMERTAQVSEDTLQELVRRGGEIYLPPGTIHVSNTISITTHGTKLIGSGMDKTIIQFTPGKGIDVIANDVVIADLHLTGTYLKDGWEQHSLDVRGPYSGLHFNRIKVTNGDDTGIRIGYSLRSGKRAVSKQSKITNCIIENINEGSGIEVMCAKNVLIENNQIRNTFQNGIRIAGGKNCIIKNNIVENYNMQNVIYANGIYVKGGKSKKEFDYCSNIKIFDNHIKGSTKNISIGTQTSDIEVFNNKLESTNATTGVGISLESNLNGGEFGYKNISISENEIFGDLKIGIELQTRDNDPMISGQYVYINDNKIQNYSNNGITIRGNKFGEVENIFISNNFFKEKKDVEAGSAILIAKCKDIYIKNNELNSDNKEKEIRLIQGAQISQKWKRQTKKN